PPATCPRVAMSLPKPAGERARAVAAQLGKPRLHLGIGESRIDLGVELVDDRGWRVFWRADAGPEAKLIAWHEFGHDIRQHRRARRGRAKFARPGVALLAFGRATSRK